MKNCLDCGKEFIPIGYQKYCGDYKEKGTCAHIHRSKHHTKLAMAWRKKNYARWRETDKKWKERNKDKTRMYSRKNREKRYEKIRIVKKESRLKLRFRIIQRDNFTCQYCGRKAPDVELQIDHKYPRSKGGLNKEENYITSCKECNIGKGDTILKEFNK